MCLKLQERRVRACMWFSRHCNTECHNTLFYYCCSPYPKTISRCKHYRPSCLTSGYAKTPKEIIIYLMIGQLVGLYLNILFETKYQRTLLLISYKRSFLKPVIQIVGSFLLSYLF